LFLDLEDSRAGNNQSESAHTTGIFDVISMECFQILGNVGTKEKQARAFFVVYFFSTEAAFISASSVPQP